MKNFKLPANLIRRIKNSAPSYTVSENWGRSGGYFGDYDEYASSFKSVCIYVQNGLSENTDLFLEITKGLFKIQSGANRKYPVCVFGFGNTPNLQHEGKYFDFGYLNDAYNAKKVAETISRISGAQKVNPAIIPELFPKVDIRSLYHGKTKVERDDLLIIIGRKNAVFFSEYLKIKVKSSIKKQILFIEIDKEEVKWHFGKVEFKFIEISN